MKQNNIFSVHLKDRLEEYIKQFNGKVKLYRNEERLGLILTRTNGAKYAKGDAIVFLDAHCECQKNWLVPLLARIAYDRWVRIRIMSIYWRYCHICHLSKMSCFMMITNNYH